MTTDLHENWTELSRYVHNAMKMLERRGVALAEAFFTSAQSTEVGVRNSEIFTQNRTGDAGVGFRVSVKGNKVGFACVNSISERAVNEAAKNALHIARVSSRIESYAIPEARPIKKLKGLFDARVAEANIEDIVELAKRGIDAAEGYDKRVIVKAGRVSYMSSWRGLVNTLEVDCEERETKTLIYLGASGKQDGEVTSSCVDFMFKRTTNLDPEAVGTNAARTAISLFEPKPVRSFQCPVVFGPEAVSYQLFDALTDALKGENVALGRSLWSKKIGETLASENLTIEDNALLEDGFSSRSFDDEGYPSQRTVLIRGGTLESFLHDATTANLLKTDNTGNASRYSGGMNMARAIVGNGYRAKPEIHPSNLVIQPGRKSKEQIVREIDKGVLVESMAGFAQLGSGVISAQLSTAFYIEKGEIKHPIKGGMVSGVAFDWFRQVSEIGNDSKQFVDSVVPSLKVENVKVIGS